MAFCTVCGAKLEQAAKFCVVCGAKVEPLMPVDAPAPQQPADPPAAPAPDAAPETTPDAAPQTIYGSYPAYPETPASDGSAVPPLGDASAQPDPGQATAGGPDPAQAQPSPLNAPEFSADFDPQDIAGNKIMAVLAYISWLVLIPLFARRQSPFARFHSNQGLILALAGLAITVLRKILVDRLALPIGFVFSILTLAVVIFSVIGIFNAAQGKAKELPLIGSIRILK